MRSVDVTGLHYQRQNETKMRELASIILKEEGQSTSTVLFWALSSSFCSWGLFMDAMLKGWHPL